MRKLGKLLLSLVVIIVTAALHDQAAADIWVTITDTVTSHKPGNWLTGFTRPVAGTPGSTDTLPLLLTEGGCTNRPCKPAFGDGFVFRDACLRYLTLEWNLLPCPSGTVGEGSAGIARIIKYEDASNRRIELRGLLVTAQSAITQTPRKVTIRFGTEQGKDFAPIGPGNLPWATILSGAFTRFPPQTMMGGRGLTESCIKIANNPNMDPPCARLHLKINDQEVNDARPVWLRNVSIPCSNASGSRVPCGGGNPYEETGGTFTAVLEDVFPLDQNMVPYMQMELADVNFTKKDQTFASIASAVMAVSSIPADEVGVESLFYSLTDDLGADYWVQYSPLTKSFFIRQDTATLASIWKDGAPALEQAKFSRSYASFIAEPLRHKWAELSTLEFVYDFIVGRFRPSEEIGVVTLDDCAQGSFYLLVKLVNASGKRTKDLKIYMGTPQTEFKAGCVEAQKYLSKSNLIKNDEYRVDGKMSIKQSQGQYQDYYLRSISMVVESKSTKANYGAKLYSATVGNIKGLVGPPSRRRAPDKFAQVRKTPSTKY